MDDMQEVQESVPRLTPCLFCRDPVEAGAVGIGTWYGHLCHMSCSEWLKEGNLSYKRILAKGHRDYDSTHTPVVYAWCGTSFQEYDSEWMKLTDTVREKLYRKYLKYLNALLDHQERAVRAYCAKYGLGEPKIIRELKQANNHMIEIFRLMEDPKVRPGDHLVMALPPRSQHHKHMAAQLTINIATRLARRGVTFHSAFLGLDWSKPVAQAAVKLALNIQLWQQSIYKEQMVYTDEGRIRRVHGYSYSQIKAHQLFQWVVGNVRDKYMSPAELWEASRKYWSCHVFAWPTRKWWCILITRDRFLCYERRKQNHYFCRQCRRIGTNHWCERCDSVADFCKVRVVLGVHLNLNRRKHENEETYTKLWAFYCDNNPDQDRQPWLSRSRFPEHLSLQNIPMHEICDDPVDME